MKHTVLGLVFLAVLSCGEHKPTQLIKDLDQLESRVTGNDLVKTDTLSPKIDAKTQVPDENRQPDLHRDSLVAFARKYIGTPYKFACADPEKGFDCSGFISFVYQHHGYKVPRSSPEFEFFGTSVDISEARKGDLVLFKPTESDSTGARIGHIGILINEHGMQSDFIHSSSGKANGVTISSLGSPHYSQRFVKVIDVIGD